MDRDRLQDVLIDARVPEGLQDLVLVKGFDCPSDFAAFPTIADLQPFIVSARGFWTANNVEDPESSVAAARLRKALAECHRLSMSSAAPSEPAANSRSPCVQPNQIASWAEHLPPKLTSQQRVSSLVETFKSNCPGELLDADTTPSIRLLSLVHEGLKPGQSLKWVPWQYRLSSRQYQERMEAKSARAVRSGLQLLSQAFFDDTPEVSVEHHSLSAGCSFGQSCSLPFPDHRPRSAGWAWARLPRHARTAYICKGTCCLALEFHGGSTHLLLQAHPCPGSSATFSNPGKKSCGRFDLPCSFGWSCLGSS